MPTEKDIIKILKTVMDPELGIDVYSLGLIRGIKILKNTIKITMTLTTPMCPYAPMLIDMITESIEEKYKLKTEIEMTFDPPWEPSEELKAMFGI